MSRGLVLAALAAALATAGAPARAAAQDPELFGVAVNRVVNDDFTPAHWDAEFAAIHAGGIRVARTDAFWMWAEHAPPDHGDHDYDWTMLDKVAAKLAEHGLRWLPILDYSALWAASDQGDYHSPPTSNDDYAAYAGAFARRYGRDGTFWQQHPELPYLPPVAYEVWNEPNGAWFWRPAPDAARYAEMYLKARGQIREADDRATVIVGGLTPDLGFVEAMYGARGDLRGNVDGIGLHPYAPSADQAIGHVVELRRTLERVGDPHVPIHVTETGWPTRGDGSPIVLPEPDRAAELERLTDSLARSDCGIASIAAYTWTTPGQDEHDIEDWYGIRAPDGTSTTTSDAYERVVARWAADPPEDSERLRLCHPPDADADGSPDSADPDDDGDGAPDLLDAFPLDATEQFDLDLDNSGNNADPDDDGDGVPDLRDAFPLDRNEQRDLDADGSGDNADPDDDGDGLADTIEARRGSSPRDLDSDDDGLADAIERRTSPARSDSDRDGLKDGLERGISQPIADPPGPLRATNPLRFRPDRHPSTRTSALRADTDRDGIRDGREDRSRDGRRQRRETDPLKRDTDGDRIADGSDRRPLGRARK